MQQLRQVSGYHFPSAGLLRNGPGLKAPEPPLIEGTARCDSRTTPPTGSTGFPTSATRIFDVPPLAIPGFAVRTPSLATGPATGELGFGFMSSAWAIPAVDASNPHATATAASSRLTRVRTRAASMLLTWPPLDAWRVVRAVMGGLSNRVVTS